MKGLTMIVIGAVVGASVACGGHKCPDPAAAQGGMAESRAPRSEEGTGEPDMGSPIPGAPIGEPARHREIPGGPRVEGGGAVPGIPTSGLDLELGDVFKPRRVDLSASGLATWKVDLGKFGWKCTNSGGWACVPCGTRTECGPGGGGGTKGTVIIKPAKSTTGNYTLEIEAYCNCDLCGDSCPDVCDCDDE